VLTWNVHKAIRAEELGRKKVDLFICLDERRPAFFNQRDVITAKNCGLFFNELFGAFGTQPSLGSIFLYRRREQMLKRLRTAAESSDDDMQDLVAYEHALASGAYMSDTRMDYFADNIYSHQRLNAFAALHGQLPLLRPSTGCDHDVAELLARRLSGKRIVVIHMRLRLLDAGYGANRIETRDSDFLEWYSFLRVAVVRHPDVQFVVLGRLQEKPLELLKMPNVISLRTLGLGLGHELTLMLRSDLFIGASSGFAAMVFFSKTPYFVTRMTPGACRAYSIDFGSDRLPFATERQTLVYEPETSEMLMCLLERGLEGVSSRNATEEVPNSTGNFDTSSTADSTIDRAGQGE